jgi:hypothetical protein
LAETYAERVERFRALNDHVWGEGMWTSCHRCPDDFGAPSFHSVFFHGQWYLITMGILERSEGDVDLQHG